MTDDYREDPFKKYGGQAIEDQDDPFKKYGGTAIAQPNKKKVSSAGFGANLGSGGTVGISEAQSGKDNWVDRIFGNGLPQQPKDEGATGLTSTGNKEGGIPTVTMDAEGMDKAAVIDYLNRTKEKQQPVINTKGAIIRADKFSPSKEKVTQEAYNEINSVMYDMGDKWKDPVKHVTQSILSKNAIPTEKDVAIKAAADELIRKSVAGSGFQAKQLMQNSEWGKGDADNKTTQLIKSRADEYDKATTPFHSVDNNANFDTEFYDAAIRAYANKHPVFKKQLEATGVDLNDYNLQVRLGDSNAKVGQIASYMMTDPDVIEYFQKEKPEMLPMIAEKANNIIYENKDFGVAQLANDISKDMQKGGYNKIDPIFNLEGQAKKTGDATAKALYADDPKKFAFYEAHKDEILNNLDAPSFFEGMAGGIKSTLGGIGNTFSEPFTSTKKSLQDTWEKEASNVSADPDGLVGALRSMGHALGVVGTIGATGNIAALGYAPGTAQMMAGTVPFFGDMLKEGRAKYPDSPIKAYTSATFNTILYGLLSKDLFPASKIKGAFTEIKPQVDKIAESLASGSITREAARQDMQSVYRKALNLVGGTLSKDTKISLELTGITGLNRGLDKVLMDNDEFKEFHKDNELADTFKSMFLSNSLVAGMAKYGEMKQGNKIVEENLYEAATSPLQTQRDIDALSVKDPSVNAEELRNNLKFLIQTKGELDARGIDPQKQKRYLFEALREKVLTDQRKSVPEGNLLRKHDAELTRIGEVQDKILNGDKVEGIEEPQPQEGDKELLEKLKSKAGELEQGVDLDYFQTKAAEDPAKYIEKYGEETVSKLIESVPTETLKGNLDLFLEMNPEHPSVKILDDIITDREKSENPPIDQNREVEDKASNVGGDVRTINDFANENESYRVIVGDEAFNDIVESGVVRTNADNKSKKEGGIDLGNRPTAFPSFSRGKASIEYAAENPNNYIIVTEDASIQPSKSGRHGKGTTMFPTDENGNHLKELSGEKVKVYKHIGDGKYELVYANGKAVEQPLSKQESGASNVGGDVEATAKSLAEANKNNKGENHIVIQNIKDKIATLRDKDGNIPNDKMEEFKSLRKALGALNEGIVQRTKSILKTEGDNQYKFTDKDIAEAYHKAKEDGSNPELVKAVEQSLSKQESGGKAPVTKPEGKSDVVVDKVDDVGGDVVGKTFRDNYNRTFEVKGENAGILTLEDVDTGKVLRKKKSEVLSDFKEITDSEVAINDKIISDAKVVGDAFGLKLGKSYKGDDVYVGEIKNVRLNPKEFSVSEFGQEEKVNEEGAENIDLSEPIEAEVQANGAIKVTDGHHRLWAARKLGKDLNVNLTIPSTKIKEISPLLNEIYQNSKADGTNPELVKAVEQSLSKQESGGKAPVTKPEGKSDVVGNQQKVETKRVEKVAELEAERDMAILREGKPEVKMEFVTAKELVDSKDPIGNKKIHTDIKDRYKKMRELLDCLWA